MEKARLTPWGGAAREVLLGFVSAKRAEGGVVFGLVPPEATYGFLRPAFQPWFPQLQRAYAPVQQGFRPGLYIFKVNLGRAWRRLAVPAHNTLEHLAQAILSAFDFDHDHLYDFKYRDQLGKAREFTHPFCAEGPHTTEIQVGNTLLPEKETMKLLYDYGDCWRFSVRLERIDPPDKTARHSHSSHLPARRPNNTQARMRRRRPSPQPAHIRSCQLQSPSSKTTSNCGGPWRGSLAARRGFVVSATTHRPRRPSRACQRIALMSS